MEEKLDRILLLLANMDKKQDELQKDMKDLKQDVSALKNNLATVMEAINATIQLCPQDHRRRCFREDADRESECALPAHQRVLQCGRMARNLGGGGRSGPDQPVHPLH